MKCQSQHTRTYTPVAPSSPIECCASDTQKRTKINKKRTISDYILQHLFFAALKIDLGYLMLPLNNILTFIHKVSLLNYWGRKRDFEFLDCCCVRMHGNCVCVHGLHVYGDEYRRYVHTQIDVTAPTFFGVYKLDQKIDGVKKWESMRSCIHWGGTLCV